MAVQYICVEMPRVTVEGPGQTPTPALPLQGSRCPPRVTGSTAHLSKTMTVEPRNAQASLPSGVILGGTVGEQTPSQCLTCTVARSPKMPPAVMGLLSARRTGRWAPGPAAFCSWPSL